MLEAEFRLLMHVVFFAVLGIYLLICSRDKQVRRAVPCLVFQVGFLVLAYWNFLKLLDICKVLYPSGLDVTIRVLWMGISWTISMVMGGYALYLMKTKKDQE